MNRAEELLWWYFNVALVSSDIPAMDHNAVSLGLANWECGDPNIELVTRARPIRKALNRCSPRDRRRLRLAFTETAWRYAPDKKAGAVAKGATRPQQERFERMQDLCYIFGDRLAPLVDVYKPKGTTGAQRVWAEAALRVAVKAFKRQYEVR